MIKNFICLIAALLFPWLLLLIYGKPGKALFALVLQVTAIGWPMASYWAWGISRAVNKNSAKQGNNE